MFSSTVFLAGLSAGLAARPESTCRREVNSMRVISSANLEPRDHRVAIDHDVESLIIDVDVTLIKFRVLDVDVTPMRPGISLDQLVDILDLAADEMLQLDNHPHEQTPSLIEAQQGMSNKYQPSHNITRLTMPRAISDGKTISRTFLMSMSSPTP
jgi:hypothetical protein